ncbi:MAG: DUF4012 domain-containing protein [Patescibacteria group bacterium]|nr:DUF4012 domain-containing protein [Patescibacteria group bacterium]MCL5431668.1 DUF4012 domain-containing protein [Patescibacteria group bacterium]
MEQRKLVQAKVEEGRPVAVVYDGGLLARKLAELLRGQGLRVIHLTPESPYLAALEKPSYVFFFIDQNTPEKELKTAWRDLQVAAVRGLAKLIVIADNSPADWAQSELPVKLVEISGEASVSDAVKIVRLAFSANRKLILTGRPIAKILKATSYQLSAPIVSKKQWPRALIIGIIAFLVFISPLWVTAGLAGWGVWQLKAVQADLLAGQFSQAQSLASEAAGHFRLAANFSQPLLGRYYDWLLLGNIASDAAGHVAAAGQLGHQIAGQMLTGNGGIPDFAALSAELAAIDRDLGLLEGQLAGTPAQKYQAKIPAARQLLARAQSFLNVIPAVVGNAGSTKKTYLVVFQNSTELRPTGGFIGSYAIVGFDKGALLDYKINDIYSADGQLQGQVQPPDELLHYLGQPSWYMRDANWAADWSLTAQRLEWFLQRETGQQVDGVIGVSLPAVPKLLAATGPLTLADFNQTVSSSDFYNKAEYASEINFFPGSTQKGDFLGAVAQAIVNRVTGGTSLNLIALGQALGDSVSQKDILFYFNDPTVQKVMETNDWAGRLCSDCLMLVDANLGANKANYFIKRSVAIDTLIDKTGARVDTVAIHYQNTSPNDSWPGGVYKDYFRLLIPQGSSLLGADLGDGRKPAISGILTAEVLKNLPASQFLIFKNLEDPLQAFGTYFEIPAGQARTLTYKYQPPDKLDLTNKEPVLHLQIARQPGTSADPLSWTVDYPSFLTPQVNNLLALPQKLIYNTDLSVDRQLEIKFLSL